MSQGTDTTQNTMIDPRIVTNSMIQAELDAINRGDAIVDRQHGTAWINGRLWGYHTDNGRMYSIQGDGFVSMSAIQYYALRIYARYNGINLDSERELAHHPDLTDEDRELARRVWWMREKSED
jgi:hypothetical protein